MIENLSFEDGVREILEGAYEIVCAKQHDYGHGNILNGRIAQVIEAWKVEGVTNTRAQQLAIVNRLGEKVDRLVNLFGRRDEAQNESIEDTVIDLIGLSVVFMMVESGTFRRQLREDMDE